MRINFENLNIKKTVFHKILKEKYGIMLQVHYIPTYRLQAFKNNSNIKNLKNKFKKTEQYYNESFSIPLHLKLSKKNITYICKAIDETINALK